MAIRPIFLPANNENEPVRVESVEFMWHPGLSKSQKQRSVRSMHAAAKKQFGIHTILEISSKSEVELGRRLSAFQLSFKLKGGEVTTVEAAFQGSKVFAEGGPYADLYCKDALDAKRDARLKESGQLVSFRANGRNWPLEPKTLFYDWIYLNALLANSMLARHLIEYEAYTDIEFNPEKSFNCQAHSAAAYVQLSRTGRLEEIMSSADAFTNYFCKQSDKHTKESQLSLLG